MKIALVHDYLNQYGGAERVLEACCELFPDAPIYTLLYDVQGTRNAFAHREIHTSFLQTLPFASRYHRILPPLMPLATEQLDLSAYDIILSNSSSFSKGVITKPHAIHINYCSTPTRFLWDDSQRYLAEAVPSPWLRILIAPFLTYLRIWDVQASARVDYFVANSHFVKKRIARYYHRDAEVIHPPVDAERFYISDTIDDYFLMVGRLVHYKRFDLAIQVFNAIEKPLTIVGDGPDRARLEAMAGPTIKFLGWVEDRALPRLYSRAQAFIFPQEEDFGIVALEAMASGRPVIAYRGGGALETVQEGYTGVFFDDQSEISLALAVGQMAHMQFNPNDIREHALTFDTRAFKNKLMAYINYLTL